MASSGPQSWARYADVTNQPINLLDSHAGGTQKGAGRFLRGRRHSHNPLSPMFQFLWDSTSCWSILEQRPFWGLFKAKQWLENIDAHHLRLHCPEIIGDGKPTCILTTCLPIGEHVGQGEGETEGDRQKYRNPATAAPHVGRGFSWPQYQKLPFSTRQAKVSQGFRCHSGINSH